MQTWSYNTCLYIEIELCAKNKSFTPGSLLISTIGRAYGSQAIFHVLRKRKSEPSLWHLISFASQIWKTMKLEMILLVLTWRDNSWFNPMAKIVWGVDVAPIGPLTVHKQDDKTMKSTILWKFMFENPIIELANNH